ncbi:hypothetical protein ACFVVX_20165 [Kitasatospora sp. NPDC058170]|uniref:hypothetical protein n=1 Tax=Kitasatospora sp. NPDC058170 TaxID=3346364 RepID=UPI0036D84870
MTGTPQPVGRRSVLRGLLAAGAAASLPQIVSLASASAAGISTGSYAIRFDQAAKQTIAGLGFEIQSDSIGSGNQGMPDLVSGVPYDLTPAERTRFQQQMLKAGRSDRGFRYCRLAMGLYHRGLTPDRKRFVDRYENQTALLADMVRGAGVEGLAVEYWSPAPGWKANNSLIKGSLASGIDLAAFGDALVDDLRYLSDRGLRISYWGLQNEPRFQTNYASCAYTPAQYLAALKAVAPKIRAAHPGVRIHAESLDGWKNDIGKALTASPEAMALIDGWSFHRIGKDSTEQITGDFTSGAGGKPVFNNEFEYLQSQGPMTDWRTVNTAQSIMNWMTFQNSPTWWWLHALKPTTNAESEGYSLGFWRPPHDTDFSHHAQIQVGHWDFNPRNWNAVSGFVKYMPWDSVRYHVDEPRHTDGAYYSEHRIMAWRTTAGKPVFALTNRSATEPFTYTVDTQTAAGFQGHRYGPATNDRTLAAKTGPTLEITVPPLSIEFWVRTP